MIPTFILFGLCALLLLLVLLLGLSARRRNAGLEQRLVELRLQCDRLSTERDTLLNDTNMLRAQIRPLADEIDRLNRTIAKRDKLATTATDIIPQSPSVSPPAYGLQDLKGVGDKFATQLQSLGIVNISQIAGWSSTDIAGIDAAMGAFHGRITRDRLVEQARLLHEGRLTEFETRFGKLS